MADTGEPVADKCQACGSDRRSDPRLQLKISRKCYHRVCTKCLDRDYGKGGKVICPTHNNTKCVKDMFQGDWRFQTFEDVALEREIDLRRRVFKILDRPEDDFESKRNYDDFLELREEFVMNLSLRTDVITTNRKLRDYQIANGLIVDKELQDAPETKKKAQRRKIDDGIDRSGLIKGLKKRQVAKQAAAYDPFQGMPITTDYYRVTEDYDTGYNEYKKNVAMLAGGYDFQEALGESLLRAFAGLGVFIDEEKTQSERVGPTTHKTAVAAIDDVL